jgi:transcriptional regulator with XRE-family HTH domain
MTEPVRHPMKKAPNDIDRHVGSRVRARRLALGITQEALGAALGITFQQIQKYEKGVNRIGSGRLQGICDVLNVPVGYFFDGTPGTEGFGADAAKDFDAIMTIPDGIRLVRAFMALGDPGLQHNLVVFVEAAVGLGCGPDPVKTVRESHGLP